MDAIRNGLWRRWDGPLTQDLVQTPGEFGLGRVPARLKPNGVTTSVCGFCSTGCGLRVHLRDGEALNLSADPSYPVNLGMACPKGWEALTPLAAKDRATTPLLRNARGVLEPVDWQVALDTFCERFKTILREHGPESVAWLGTGQICVEELAFLGALGKFGMGLVHGDGNTRQCMATAVSAYKQAFGFDAPPYTYADFEESDVIVLVGSNLCITHPILWQRVMRNPHRPEILVIDPRRTETAMAATQHYAIRPKSDLTLFYGIAHLLIANGWFSKEAAQNQCRGFTEFAQFVRNFDPVRVSSATGLEEPALRRLAEIIGKGRRVSFWWTMGVNQGHEATRTAQALINLALITGNIGRPGTGANSITGQCNAMGSRLFSNTTNLLGGRDFTQEEDRLEVAQILGIPLERIPARQSLAYDQILDGIGTGRIKGLWVVATNPSHSWIDQNAFHALRGKLDFLVVQDMYSTTETAQQADLVLPSAGWGEKEGTFINSERRFGRTRQVAKAPGSALSDFRIFRLIAQAWGVEGLFREWTSPEAVFQILKKLSQGRPCDISGIEDYAHLERCGGIQWPWAGPGDPDVERRLFEDGRFYHGDGKARLLFEEPRPPREQPDPEYPFVLLTGRGSSAQWHTQTRTAKSEVLRKLAPESVYVEVNPADALRIGIADKGVVEVRSRRGSVRAQAFHSASVQVGQVFLPMHYAMVNQLTCAEFDPYSRQPSYKACAVAIAPSDGPCSLAG